MLKMSRASLLYVILSVPTRMRDTIFISIPQWINGEWAFFSKNPLLLESVRSRRTLLRTSSSSSSAPKVTLLSSLSAAFMALIGSSLPSSTSCGLTSAAQEMFQSSWAVIGTVPAVMSPLEKIRIYSTQIICLTSAIPICYTTYAMIWTYPTRSVPFIRISLTIHIFRQIR